MAEKSKSEQFQSIMSELHQIKVNITLIDKSWFVSNTTRVELLFASANNPDTSKNPTDPTTP